jgi:hypothetical protein
MAWEGSTRRERLPPYWRRLRAYALDRAGYQGEHTRYDTGLRCGALATDVDHIERGDHHDVDNLQALCRWLHGRKSSREGGQASSAQRETRTREPEAHPRRRAE